MLCPPINSFMLAKNLPMIKIVKAHQAGHYVSDPGIKELMKNEINALQNL